MNRKSISGQIFITQTHYSLIKNAKSRVSKICYFLVEKIWYSFIYYDTLSLPTIEQLFIFKFMHFDFNRAIIYSQILFANDAKY